jgi:hypothetical protein
VFVPTVMSRNDPGACLAIEYSSGGQERKRDVVRDPDDHARLQ